MPQQVFAETVTEAATYDELTQAISNGKTSIKLTADIELSGELIISKTLTLGLNGHVLALQSGVQASIFRVTGGIFTLKDSAPQTVHTGTYAALPNGGVLTGGTGTQIDNEGYIYYLGGAVLIQGDATFMMNGGSITGCKAGWGDSSMHIFWFCRIR